MPKKTLNDHVEAVLKAIVADDNLSEKFRGFLEAVRDEQAIEGSIAADNFEAAVMIREKATELKIAAVSDQKLAFIVRALSVVLRRFGMSRRERA